MQARIVRKEGITMGPDRNKAMEMYKTMFTIRTFEGRESQVYYEGLQDGFVHLYIGEEAIAAGVCAALNSDDFITSTHRGHGHIIAKGGDLNKIMAELFGRKTGYCQGKGGSMHIAAFELGILGANGMVAGGIPIATGAALSAVLRKSKQVTVCFFGDGAINEGAFHSSLNLASAWKLPVVYVCENNRYGVSTPISRVTNIADDLSVRAKAYNMPGRRMDSDDVMRVYGAACEAVGRAREGGGPSLLVFDTARFGPHFQGEAESFPAYRPENEVAEAKCHDPIDHAKRYLAAVAKFSAEEVCAVEEEIKKKVEAAIVFAQQSAKPDPKSAAEGLFA